VAASRNPTFHRKEIEEGVGKSNNVDFVIFSMESFFITWVFIRRRRKSFGLDGDRVLKHLA